LCRGERSRLFLAVVLPALGAFASVRSPVLLSVGPLPVGAGFAYIQQGKEDPHVAVTAVVPWPHPQTGGYTWHDPSNRPVHGVAPKPTEVPLLPETWVCGLSERATEGGRNLA
jgi:hypothetical protein